MDIRVLEFSTEYDKATGKERHWVLYAPAHNIQNCQTWERIDRLMPPEKDSIKNDPMGTKHFHMRAVWSCIGPHYDAWVAGEEIPEDGQSLKSWAGVNKAQIKVLVAAGIKTVEALAEMSDSGLEKIKLPYMRNLRAQAVEYVAGKGDTKVAAEIIDTKEKLAASELVIAEMQEQLASMKTLVDSMNEEAQAGKKPGKPGRPSKKAKAA
jgi:hypothetical protein